jgi:exonuclease III
MRVLSWNVQGAFPPQGSPDRISNQVEYIQDEAENPDLLMLNEVTTDRQDLWHELLHDAGYESIVDTLGVAHEIGETDIPPYQDRGGRNGNLTAIHRDSGLTDLSYEPLSIHDGVVENSVKKYCSTNFPEKILNTTVEIEGEGTKVDLWNVRTVPGSMYGEEKIKILEDVYGRVLGRHREREWPCILAGDLNLPKDETDDGDIVTFERYEVGERWAEAERNILTGLEEVGMVDVFRHIHGYGDLDVLDVSHPTGDSDGLSGVRFDHIVASQSLDPQSCRYDRKGLDCSDHTPVVAEFSGPT